MGRWMIVMMMKCEEMSAGVAGGGSIRDASMDEHMQSRSPARPLLRQAATYVLAVLRPDHLLDVLGLVLHDVVTAQLDGLARQSVIGAPVLAGYESNLVNNNAVRRGGQREHQRGQLEMNSLQSCGFHFFWLANSVL